MKTEELEIFRPIVLQIDSVEPSLERDGLVYANIVNGKTKSGEKYQFRERHGIPVKQFIGKPVECIFEILDADFLYPESEDEAKKLPEDVKKGKYLWVNSGYKFIPELVEMIEGHRDEEDYEYDEDEYDRIAGDYFEKWGISGLGLDIYRDKPMVETEEGVFLFNEYQNEEEIEEWQLNDPIYFRPKEILLRGIRLYEGEFEVKKTLEEIYDVKPYEMLIVGDWIEIDNFKRKWWSWKR